MLAIGDVARQVSLQQLFRTAGGATWCFYDHRQPLIYAAVTQHVRRGESGGLLIPIAQRWPSPRSSPSSGSSV